MEFPSQQEVAAARQRKAVAKDMAAHLTRLSAPRFEAQSEADTGLAEVGTG